VLLELLRDCLILFSHFYCIIVSFVSFIFLNIAFGGSLKQVSATDLGVVATKAALVQANNLDPTLVDEVYFGNVISSSNDAAYIARHVALKSGMKLETPSLTLNRLCGSGFETVIQAAKAITLGQANIVIAGGTENMSAAPLSAYGNSVRWGTPLGKGLPLSDALWDGLTDAYAKTPMGVTAENLAVQYNITRSECDEFAIRSQQTWQKAQEAGIFEHEMAPVEIPNKKKGTTDVITTDEHPRPQSVLEKLAKLPSVFQKDGVVTAASSSGICDGAGAVLVVSEQALKEHNLQPLARLAGYSVAGCDPTIMGIGPVPAIRQTMEQAGVDLHSQVDRIEINEAFAAQFLACAKELELDMDKTNIHGGAISIGHPLGASGSRITAHLANEFSYNTTSKYHLGAACIGGGQGIAVLLERA